MYTKVLQTRDIAAALWTTVDIAAWPIVIGQSRDAAGSCKVGGEANSTRGLVGWMKQDQFHA